MLAHRLRRWANIKSTFGKRFVFAGKDREMIQLRNIQILCRYYVGTMLALWRASISVIVSALSRSYAFLNGDRPFYTRCCVNVGLRLTLQAAQD